MSAARAELELLAWPPTRVADALTALAHHFNLSKARLDSFESASGIGERIECAAKHLGCEAESIETNYRDLETDLAAAHPALLRVSESLFVAIVGSRRGKLRVLTPNLRVRSVAIGRVSDMIREPLARAGAPFGSGHAAEVPRADYEALLSDAKIPISRQSQIISALLAEQLSDHPFDQCWKLRPSPGAPALRWFGMVGGWRNGAGLVTAHIAQYCLWLASWVILGRLSLAGRMDRGWLFGWALLLLTMISFRVLTTWKQGLLAIGIGGFLKRRLLHGALRIDPEEMRHCGIGSFVAQAFEAEAVETLALSGGIGGLLSTIELILAGCILGRLAVLLAVWVAIIVLFGWRFLGCFQRWTTARMRFSQDLIESMVGHRTRVAQLPQPEWHESEDRAMADYLAISRSLDHTGTVMMAGLPRGWLIAALVCLTPAIMSGQSSGLRTAITLGGILLAFTALTRLVDSFPEIAGAAVSWKRIAPLFRAAARPEDLGQLVPQTEPDRRATNIIEADRLTFRYRPQGNPALQACTLAVRRGDRILLEGPSGGGKTTLASVLCGMRRPESGLLLAGGLDRHTLGMERWRKCVAAAPQFHENHILTETLAFNLLMGRRWPASASDMKEAEALCRELGLGDLLDAMPSGILQMVGDGGWQLSHGERSRVFIARALLRDAEVIILDESFAALDPENLRTALECTLRRAETLMVIAHP